MKKCHHCSGRGFILDFISSYKLKIAGFGMYTKGVKVPCPKCYGKGRK